METVWKGLVTVVVLTCLATGVAFGQRPSTAGHVAELAAYLDRVQIAEPVTYGRLAVYPVLVPEGAELRGHWLTLDEAISRIAGDPREGRRQRAHGDRGEPQPRRLHFPHGRRDYLRRDADPDRPQGRSAGAAAAGRSGRFCLEHRRWEGAVLFSGGKALVPQSIQKEIRKGADQGRVWSEVARNNAALQAENRTGSLELALKDSKVADRLGEVRRRVIPEIPGVPRGSSSSPTAGPWGRSSSDARNWPGKCSPSCSTPTPSNFVVIPKEGATAGAWRQRDGHRAIQAGLPGRESAGRYARFRGRHPRTPIGWSATA